MYLVPMLFWKKCLPSLLMEAPEQKNTHTGIVLEISDKQPIYSLSMRVCVVLSVFHSQAVLMLTD